MSWSIQTFRLMAEPKDPGLFYGGGGLTLGGVPLLSMASVRFEPLPVDRLQRIFDAAYGTNSGIDARSRLTRLRYVAQALNASDLCRATIECLMLRLPEIDPIGMSHLIQIETARASKYDNNEPRDRRGRWTTGGGESLSVTSTRPETSSSGDGTRAQAARSNGRRPGTRTSNPNIIPVQSVLRALPLFPPFGGVAGKPKPKDDDDYVFPPSIPVPGTAHSANDNTDAKTRASANDNQPRACPIPVTNLHRWAERQNNSDIKLKSRASL
jgi:hypothetical protein